MTKPLDADAVGAAHPLTGGRLNRGRRKKAGFVFVLAPLAMLTFVLVHVIWRFTLPVPWSDESHFFIPAANFYNHHNFTADEMFVHNIFWMSVHLYLVNGVFFSIVNASNLHLSRDLSFVFVTASAVFLRSAVKSVLTSDHSNPAIGNALVAAWYVSLPIVFSADLMRPDGLSLCLSTATIALALKERYIGAFSIALASGVTHPLEAFPSVVVGICVLPLCNFRKAAWFERLLISWAGALFLFEGSRVISDFGLYRLHMTLQVGNKTAHHIPFYTYLLVPIVIALLGYILWRGFRRTEDSRLDYLSRQLVTVEYSLVCIFVAAFAREMWYFVWELTGFALLFTTAFQWLQRLDPKQSGLRQSIVSFVEKRSLIVAALLFALGLSTWALGYRSKGIYGFYTNPHKLFEIREDQKFLLDSITSSLNGMGATRVLLPPFLYGFFIGGGNPTGTLRFRTLNPFSRLDGEELDHLVLLTRGYPKAATENGPPGALSNRTCSPLLSIVTPHGYYRASIIGVSAQGSLRKDVKLCGILRLH